MAGQAEVTIKGRVWLVSVAVTPYELSKGLGGLESIEANTGMFFDVGYEQPISVTSAPMLFPIDVVFMDSGLRVTGVVLDMQPGYEVTYGGRYFLEVNAGEAVDVEIGDIVDVVALDYQAPIEEGLFGFIPILGFVMVLAVVVAAIWPKKGPPSGGEKPPSSRSGSHKNPGNPGKEPQYPHKGPGYTAPPLELESHTNRGVVYLHNLATGQSTLRICRVPENVMERIPRYGAELDLSTATPRLGLTEGRTYKKSPVFLSMDRPSKSFMVVTEAGEGILTVKAVPTRLLDTLDKLEFTDITVGISGYIPIACKECGSIIRAYEHYYNTPTGIYCSRCVPKVYKDDPEWQRTYLGEGESRKGHR